MKLIGLMKTMNGVSSCVRYLAMICIGIQLMGCSALLRSNVSVPDKNTPGASFRGGDIVDFKGPDIDLNIQVQNHRPSFGFVQLFLVPIIPVWATEKNEENESDLIIWINIVAKDNTFAFDPSRVILKFDDGTNVQMNEFVGPLDPWHSPRTEQEGCGKRRYSLGVATSRTVVDNEDIKTRHGSIPIPFEKESRGSCFLLKFKTNGSPERTFTLSLEGIDKSGTQHTVPQIRFRKGATWNMFPVP